MSIKSLAASAAAIAASFSLGAVANAAFLDFTDAGLLTGTVDTPTSVSIDGIGVTITSSASQIFLGEALDDPSVPFCQEGGARTFACDQDGIGIRGDEISEGSYVQLDFSQAVDIRNIFLLDIFEAPDGSDEERGIVASVNGEEAVVVTAEDLFQEVANGFADYSVDLGAVTSIRFLVGEGNDSIGVGDFALAGLTFDASPIPVPGAMVLFATAMGAAGAARRRARG